MNSIELVADRISAGYGPIPVIVDVDLQVRSGEMVALLGANGVGKTTTLRVLAGVMKPTRGVVKLNGEPMTSPLHARARAGFRFVPEDHTVIRQLTTLENLRIGPGPVHDSLELFPELVPLLKRKAGLLSGGEQKMLALARAMSGNPRLLLADEVSLGLAPLVVRRLLSALRQGTRRGIGVLIVEQHPRVALEFADRGYVMSSGQISLTGTAEQLRHRLSDIEDAYLSGRDRENHSPTGPE